jgi:hypothetical protein
MDETTARRTLLRASIRPEDNQPLEWSGREGWWDGLLTGASLVGLAVLLYPEYEPWLLWLRAVLSLW